MGSITAASNWGDVPGIGEPPSLQNKISIIELSAPLGVKVACIDNETLFKDSTIQNPKPGAVYCCY